MKSYVYKENRTLTSNWRRFGLNQCTLYSGTLYKEGLILKDQWLVCFRLRIGSSSQGWVQ